MTVNQEILNSMIDLQIGEDRGTTLIEYVILHTNFISVAYIEMTNDKITDYQKEKIFQKMSEFQNRLNAIVYGALIRFTKYQNVSIDDQGYYIKINNDVIHAYVIALLDKAEQMIHDGLLTSKGKIIYAT